MEFLSFSWDYRAGKNVEKVERNGLSLDDVEEVLNHPVSKTTSRDRHRRPLYIGFATDGRLAAVAFERLDLFTARPITAFFIDED